MSDENEPVDEPRRQAPRRRDDSEKGLGLEMARLFGINPKVMMAPKTPARASEEEQADAVEACEEPLDDPPDPGHSAA